MEVDSLYRGMKDHMAVHGGAHFLLVVYGFGFRDFYELRCAGIFCGILGEYALRITMMRAGRVTVCHMYINGLWGYCRGCPVYSLTLSQNCWHLVYGHMISSGDRRHYVDCWTTKRTLHAHA